MIDRSLKYRRAGRSAELRLFRGEQTVLNTSSLQTAECRFRVGQSRQFDRAPITCGLTRNRHFSGAGGMSQDAETGKPPTMRFAGPAAARRETRCRAD